MIKQPCFDHARAVSDQIDGVGYSYLIKIMEQALVRYYTSEINYKDFQSPRAKLTRATPGATTHEYRGQIGVAYEAKWNSITY